MADASESMTAPKRMEDPRPESLRGDGLRKVEIDVIIPKMMKKAAITQCADVAAAFTECCKNRTVSIMWACRDVNTALDDCLRRNLTDVDFVREKANFLKLKQAETAQQALHGDQGFKATSKSESSF